MKRQQMQAGWMVDGVDVDVVWKKVIVWEGWSAALCIPMF